MRKEVRLTFIQAVVFFFFFLLLRCCDSKKTEGNCPPSSCGVLQNQIEYPFRLKTDPKNCGDPQYELACESNQTVLHVHSKKYYVDRISYDKKVIHVVDPGLRSEDFSSLPLYSMSKYEFNESDPYVFATEVKIVTFLNCSVPMDNHSQMLSATACVNQSSQAYLYAVPGRMLVRDLPTSCKIEIKGALASVQKFRNPTYLDVFNGLLMGFELSWMEPLSCRDCFAKGRQCSIYPGTSAFVPFLQKRKYCFSNNGLFPSFQGFVEILAMVIYVGGIYAIEITVMALLVRATIGIPCLLVFLSCKLRRKHIWMDTTVEEFLSRYRCQTPARYSYSNIRKMTGRFKEKLGQGGYGSVYKGKLRNGRLVAIKILSGKSKGSGQEFINEVATIGRIHHVNVVRLIGFCAEGSKRALIYEFMPNGSLEKYIYPHEGKSSPLSWEKMYQIALGIARGIEYLHRGCDMKILHFDIKPHNILLDDNFNPKVSDFGLAKFYPTDESIVSVTAVRGTIGYIAPELFYKNIGGVSYKSDVYSFGMLLMEMAGRRKNINAFAKNESQIYLPLWIYDQLDQGGDIGMEDAAEDEKEVVKKMFIVALWCIQMKPANRPSMSKVVEMLEGSVELLQMPAKPFLSSPERVPNEDHATSTNPTDSSGIHELESLSGNYVESNILNVIID